jgi:hypothetical protein
MHHFLFSFIFTFFLFFLFFALRWHIAYQLFLKQNMQKKEKRVLLFSMPDSKNNKYKSPDSMLGGK